MRLYHPPRLVSALRQSRSAYGDLLDYGRLRSHRRRRFGFARVHQVLYAGETSRFGAAGGGITLRVAMYHSTALPLGVSTHTLAGLTESEFPSTADLRLLVVRAVPNLVMPTPANWMYATSVIET